MSTTNSLSAELPAKSLISSKNERTKPVEQMDGGVITHVSVTTSTSETVEPIVGAVGVDAPTDPNTSNKNKIPTALICPSPVADKNSSQSANPLTDLDINLINSLWKMMGEKKLQEMLDKFKQTDGDDDGNLN